MTSVGLKILMVTTFYPPYNFGGDGHYVAQLSRVLAQRGHKVDIVHSVDAFQTLSEGPLVSDIAQPSGVKTIPLSSKRPGLSALITHQTGMPIVHHKALKKQFAEHDYDVIHYHNISLVGGPAILKYGAGIKLYTAHEHWLVCPTHVLWRHQKEVCTSRECLRCTFKYHRPPQIWRHTSLFSKCLESVDQFIALSHFSARKHAEFGFDRPMHVMPSFIADYRDSQIGLSAESIGEQSTETTDEHSAESLDELSTVHQDQHSELSIDRGWHDFEKAADTVKRPYILFVGRLEFIKGLQDVIPVFLDDIGADLVVIGSGSLEASLKTMASESPYIHFMGSLNSNQLGRWYANAKALITPSVCYEVFPLVVLEAFQRGLPIIARDAGPFPEIVEKSKGGLLFKNTDEMRSAIVQLLQNSDFQGKLAQSARRAFDETWSETTAMKDYFGMLRSIAREQKKTELLNKLESYSQDGRMQATER